VRRLLTGLLGATLLLGACGDDGGDDRAAATSIPDDTTTSSSTTEAQVPPPDVIPRDVSLITEEYVEQVLDALQKVSLEALLEVRSEGVVGERAIALVEATSSEESATQEINDLIDSTYGQIENLRPDPMPMDISVVAVLDATATCVVAEVRTDASGLLVQVPPLDPAERDFVRIVPATEKQRTSGLNPTAWVLDAFPVTFDGTVPPGLSCT